ncbi:MAG: hypothetical protein HRT89_13790 [Lentisphaeria bacterium]|nr:hypothetical protein [Lentisphaeria bacterium]NQZ69128.1 hypothetical protein [Lentisphaeria bacterium]
MSAYDITNEEKRIHSLMKQGRLGMFQAQILMIPDKFSDGYSSFKNKLQELEDWINE